MKQSLSLKLGQQLTMTPQLQQAIRLLQLSTLDLRLEIQQVVEANPMLELVEDDDDNAAAVRISDFEAWIGHGSASVGDYNGPESPLAADSSSRSSASRRLGGSGGECQGRRLL